MSSSSIPDCVSTAHLMDMLDAKKEDTTEMPLSLKEASKEELIDFVIDGVQAMGEVIGTTFAYKLIADYCLFRLQQIHEVGYRHQLDDCNDQNRALAWARDAGHLQAMQATLKEVQCGPQDFQCPLDD
jgi:hypothetical protein